MVGAFDEDGTDGSRSASGRALVPAALGGTTAVSSDCGPCRTIPSSSQTVGAKTCRRRCSLRLGPMSVHADHNGLEIPVTVDRNVCYGRTNVISCPT
jgi:hypothetical protein